MKKNILKISGIFTVLAVASSLAFAVGFDRLRDKVLIGAGAASDKTVEFDVGGSNGTLQYKLSDTSLQFNKNIFRFGGGTTANKSLEFNVGLGASNPKLTLQNSGTELLLNLNKLLVGNGSASDKTLEFDVGAGSANPKIKYDNATAKLRFAHDGSTFADFGSGSGSGGSSGIEALEQKLDNEHYDIITGPLANSVGSGFNYGQDTVLGRMLTNYTSGITMTVAWNPLYISTSDKNTDSTTGWTAVGAGTNLTTGTAIIGSASLSFDKAGTGTEAGIRFDRGAQTLGLNGFSEFYFVVNLPSAVNLSDVYVKIYADSTSNFCKFLLTTSDTGAAVTSGQQVMHASLTNSCSSTGGTGWDVTKASRYQEVGVDTATSGQTYSGVLFDSAHFSIYQPTQLVQAGVTLTINNSTTHEEPRIDIASARVAGTVTLSSGLSNTYSGGTSSQIRRQTLVIAGDDGARMEQGLSGTIAKNQNVRMQRYLPSSLTNHDMRGMADVNTNMYFEVTEVTSSTAIKVSDTADSTANLTSGTVLHVFRTFYSPGGDRSFAYRSLDLTITSSSYSGGVTTINTGTNTGIAVGDQVLVKHVTPKISLVALSSNENFVTPTLETLTLDDLGIPYPQSNAVWANWTLSGANGYKSVKGTSGQNLTVTGTLSTTSQFKNGLYATDSFSDANRLELSAADSQVLSGSTVDGTTSLEISFWFYAPGFIGAQRDLIDRINTAETAGWEIYLNSGSNTIVSQGTTNVTATSTFTPNQWNHIVARYADGVTNGSYHYLNGVKTATYTFSTSNFSLPLFIGRGNTGAQPATSVLMSDVLVIRNGAALTAGEVEALYNRGAARRFGFFPQLKYHWVQTSMTGQILSWFLQLTRVTDAATPYLSKSGAGAF